MTAQVLQGVLIPLLIALTGYAVNLLKVKSEELKQRVQNEQAQKYIDMINETVANCVQATNQSFVDNMKANGTFDQGSQKMVFDLTLQSVKKVLSNEAMKYISTATSDTNLYLANLIESTVREKKANAN